nr:MAG TPA: hypothetical protein [Caudoviricetes sp.]
MYTWVYTDQCLIYKFLYITMYLLVLLSFTLRKANNSYRTH